MRGDVTVGVEEASGVYITVHAADITAHEVQIARVPGESDRQTNGSIEAKSADIVNKSEEK